MSNGKKGSLGQAIAIMIFLIAAIASGMNLWGADVHIPLLLAATVASIVSVTNGWKWSELLEGAVETISSAMGAIIVLMIIGMVVGTWKAAGIVPAMIYYGLQVLSPGIFLVATLIITSIVSLATGSSWTTAATIGIALMGVGQGLGIAPPIIAGCVVSGAYFGDKMSPLSDTTNLAPAVSGATLFDHIRHMIYTTGVSYIISLVLFAIIGMKYAGKALDMNQINAINGALTGSFNISILLLLPPVIVITMVALKTPAIPGLFGGALLGGIWAMVFQGAGMGDVLGAAHYGFEIDTGFEMVNELVNGGGMDSMMWTVSLILCAMVFGGIMDKGGFLEAIVGAMAKAAKSTGSLVVATILTEIFMNLTAGDQYLAIVLPGKMFKEEYAKRGLKPKNLSRVLEDGGTLTSALVPWNSCGAYMHATLGVHPFAYAPYAFLNLLNPIVSIIFAYTGFTMEYFDEEEVA
ncbi:Na+/H+ antiporter NhaC [Clostridiaceae bacterium HSG29]|nr:Na+/H+ antiporter NhaC [Clostridiaceae bacterium HSG29]